jgi:hypothetical protein
MKISYRYRILAYFLLSSGSHQPAFLHFILIRRESQLKLETAVLQNPALSDILYSSVKGVSGKEDIEEAVASLVETIPSELRITITGHLGLGYFR